MEVAVVADVEKQLTKGGKRGQNDEAVHFYGHPIRCWDEFIYKVVSVHVGGNGATFLREAQPTSDQMCVRVVIFDWSGKSL